MTSAYLLSDQDDWNNIGRSTNDHMYQTIFKSGQWVVTLRLYIHIGKTTLILGGGGGGIFLTDQNSNYLGREI